MKPLFLTMGMSNNFDGMVLDHQKRHIAYCKKWEYEYKGITSQEIPIEYDRYFRIRAILYFMKSKLYSHIFWIDADTFVANFSYDMRDTLPGWSWLGMTAHPYKWPPNNGYIDSIHLQCGIFYFRVCEESIAFLEKVLELGNLYEEDQSIINYLLLENTEESNRWQKGFKLLSYRWNNTLHDQNNNPIIAAFHGHLSPQARRFHMNEVAAKYPYSEE